MRDIAWKAQARLCARYRRLGALGQEASLRRGRDCSQDGRVLWAIGREVEPA